MLLVLDANCFIDAADPTAHGSVAVNSLLRAADAGVIEMRVSQHTLSELKSPDALTVARVFPLLPHWPIGSWEEQVATWGAVAGTWDDGRRNDEIQLELQSLAKAGSSIRDRGAYLDALYAKATAFVTSDGQLARSAPAARIQARFGMAVWRPEDAVRQLGI